MSARTIAIEPERGLWDLNLGEVWASRDLLYFLIWRDVKVRYKQTALGAGWAILQPLLACLILNVFLGRLAKIPSEGIPYPVFVYTALVPWQFFANALSVASISVVGSQSMIQKVYFPRLVLPLAAVLSGLVDFVIAFAVLGVMMLYYHVPLSGPFYLLPLFLALATATALAGGVFLSALCVQFRDVKHTVPFLVQFWMFATPVIYPSSLVPEKWRMLYSLNPMAGVVDGFRYALFGKPEYAGPMFWVALAGVLVLLALGLVCFRRMEASFADIV